MFLTGKRLPPTSAVWRTGAYYTNRKISPSSTYLAFTCRKSTSEYQRKPLNPKQEQDSSGAWLCDRVGLSFPKTLPALGRWSAAGAGDRRGGASWRGSALPRACSTASPGNTCSGWGVTSWPHWTLWPNSRLGPQGQGFSQVFTILTYGTNRTQDQPILA